MGDVIAYNRNLLLEGIYSQIELLNPPPWYFSKGKIKNIESEMDNRFKFHTAFYRYDRLALADSVLQRVNGKLQVFTYLEFKKNYEDDESNFKVFLQPAKEFVASLKGSEVEPIMEELRDIAFRIKNETGLQLQSKKNNFNTDSFRMIM